MGGLRAFLVQRGAGHSHIHRIPSRRPRSRGLTAPRTRPAESPTRRRRVPVPCGPGARRGAVEGSPTTPLEFLSPTQPPVAAGVAPTLGRPPPARANARARAGHSGATRLRALSLGGRVRS